MSVHALKLAAGDGYHPGAGLNVMTHLLQANGQRPTGMQKGPAAGSQQPGQRHLSPDYCRLFRFDVFGGCSRFFRLALRPFKVQRERSGFRVERQVIDDLE